MAVAVNPACLGSGDISMSREEKSELRCLLIWLVGTTVAYLLMPKIYPPRTLSSPDYAFMLLIPLGAAISVRPAVSWRWLLYYAILGQLPFILELERKLEIPYRIRTDGYQEGFISDVYIPCLRIFALAVLVTVVAGTVARVLKERTTKKRGV